MSSLSSSDQGAQAIMDEWIRKVQSDLPKIDQSIKNILAILLAKKPPTPPHATEEEIREYLSPQKAMDCAKHFLRALQGFSLLSIDEYALSFPQLPTQTALARLDEICRYKAFVALREYSLANNGKVSKTFGRDLFVLSRQWPALRERVLETCDVDNVSREEMETFLSLYERSIFAGSENPQEGDQDLVWSTNFNSALVERQAVRARAVSERVREATENATSELTEIVDAVSQEERE